MSQPYTPSIDEQSFPYLDTEAALMLRSALDQHKRQNKVSLRQLAKQLGYKQSAILSHMANGRVAIPLDRAEELADALHMSRPRFLSAVIKQKYRNFLEAIVELRALELPGTKFDQIDWASLNEAQLRVLREVVRDRYPEERWLTPHEVPLINLIRSIAPEIGTKGLSQANLDRIRATMDATS